MNWNLPATISDSSVTRGTKKFRARYLDVLGIYFAGLTLAFPVQIFLLQDFNFNDSIDWMDFAQQILVLNWFCMFSYTSTALALARRSNRLWAHITSSFLLTSINNTFVAFAGWDYSAIEAFSGSVLFTLPLAPTILSSKYRNLVWRQKMGAMNSTASPRFKKRWRVELLSEGQVVPATGITVNISDSGALVHLLNEAAPQNMFDVRLTEAHQGLILDCKARRVRDDILPQSNGKDPIPVMGIEFVSISDEQKAQLQDHLHKTKPAA